MHNGFVATACKTNFIHRELTKLILLVHQILSYCHRNLFKFCFTVANNTFKFRQFYFFQNLLIPFLKYHGSKHIMTKDYTMERLFHSVFVYFWKPNLTVSMTTHTTITIVLSSTRKICGLYIGKRKDAEPVIRIRNRNFLILIS